MGAVLELCMISGVEAASFYRVMEQADQGSCLVSSRDMQNPAGCFPVGKAGVGAR